MLHIYLNMLDSQDDRQKFTDLYNEYHGLVLHVAMRFFKNKQDAEDATHEAFLRITKNLDKIGEISCHKTKGFIVIVVENICRDMLRKAKRQRADSFEEIDFEVAGGDNVERDALAKSNAEIIKEKIADLAPIYQEVLTLKYAHDMSNEEIARTLGISHATVRKRIQRARELLSSVLKDALGIEVMQSE